MARPTKNELHLTPTADGRWRLHGYFNGQRIRRQSADIAPLEAEKATMESQLATAAQADAKRESLRLTWLSHDQLRDAEAATQRANGRRLLDCVVASERVMTAPEPKLCTEALKDWIEALTARRRFPATLAKNEHRIAALLEAVSVKHLHELTPLALERWVFRKGTADLTRLTDARVVATWLRFCVSRRWLATSPLEIDLKDLASGARPVEAPRILSPEQCHALLAAAKAKRDGILVPYVVLALWCFMRHAEVTRTTTDDLRLDARLPVVEIRPRKRGTVSYRAVTLPEIAIRELRAAIADGRLQKGISVFYARSLWDAVRADAGLLTRLPAARGKRRKHAESIWQENILRHTGISYHFQRCGDIRETCRQAGNSDDTAFRHYLNLPAEGAAERFYG